MKISEIKKYIKSAKKASACKEELNVITGLKTVEEILSHPHAPKWAFWYAHNVLEGRWIEAEEVIKTSPLWAYRYARDVIHGRWIEAEEVIKTSPNWAYRYASEVFNFPNVPVTSTSPSS